MNKKLIFDDVKIIELIEHKDSRGFFKETYNKKLLSKFDISNDLQDNESFS